MKKCEKIFKKVHFLSSWVLSILLYMVNLNIVERLVAYMQAARMAALQRFILDLEERMKLPQIFFQMQNVYSVF